MTEIHIDASKPVDVPALFNRLKSPALIASASLPGGRAEPIAFAIMITPRERDTLLAALRHAYPIALAGG